MSATAPARTNGETKAPLVARAILVGNGPLELDPPGLVVAGLFETRD